MNEGDGQDHDGLPKMTEMDAHRKRRSEKPTKDMTRSPRSNLAMSPEVQNKIGQQLRAVYSDIVDQGVPDRFAKLIEQLDDQAKSNKDEPK